MTMAPGVFVTIVERQYRVAGTTTRHLMEAATMMSPRRTGAQHTGYTDWQISWSFTPLEIEGRIEMAAARVEVVVTRTLPRWRAPSAADRALVSSWERLVAAIARHEQGHVDIATQGAHSLHEAIASMSPCTSLQELERRAAHIAESSLDAMRATDRAYDAVTEHGALQGVHMPW